MLGVFINGGDSHTIAGNHFTNSDHMMYMGGDSCYNPMPLAFNSLRNVSRFPAWQQAGYGNLMSVLNYSTAAEWGATEACHSVGNVIVGNTFCNLTDTQNVTWAGAQQATALCVNCACGKPECYGDWRNNTERCPLSHAAHPHP